MTPRQFLGFRGRLEAASGFQSAQFRELEAVLGRRDAGVFEHYDEASEARARIAAAMARPSLFDSFLRYLAIRGYGVPDGALARDVSRPLEPTVGVQRVLLAVYRDDGDPSQVAERLVDLDEGTQEWRYRHVKMVERTIGSKPGTGGSPGVGYLRTTLSTPVFPDLWAIRSEL
jgi:tryptophan 2,3-dioxygenase